MEDNNTPQTEPQTPENKEQKNVGCLLAFLVFIIIAIIGSYMGWFDNGGSDGIDSNIKNGAYQTAKTEVKQQLTRPSTADFSLMSADFEKFGDRVYRVTGTVKAKNALDMQQEFKYKVTMTYWGDDPLKKSSWEVTGCTVTPK